MNRPSLVGTRYMGGSLPAAFSWDAAALVHGATLVVQEPPTIASEVTQFGYCLVLPRTARPEDGEPEILRVRLRVVQGAAGIGLLRPDGTSFLQIVDGVEPDRAVEITFLIEDIRAIGSLVVRNNNSEPVTFEWLGAESAQLINSGDIDDSYVPTLMPVAGWNRYYGREARTVAELLRQFQFEALREPYVMRWMEDLRLAITPGEEASRAVFVSGVYEPGAMVVLRRLLLRGSTFIDVGANIGLYTLIASRWVGSRGHVYSFEPSAREAAVLKRNLELNGLSNVTVTQAALHEHAGTAVLRVADRQHRGQNTLATSFAYEGVQQENEESVDLMTLDELWRSRMIRRPSVIKIDVEGAEMHVLRGAVTLLHDTQPVVIFEANQTLLRASGASIDELDEFFRSIDYSVYRLDENTGDLAAVTRMAAVDSANFLAFPRHSAQARDRS